MLKKFLSLFMACIMAAGLIVVPAHAEESAVLTADAAEVQADDGIDYAASIAAIDAALESGESLELSAVSMENTPQTTAAGDYEFSEKESNDDFYNANVMYHDYTITGDLPSYDDGDFYCFKLNARGQVSIPIISGTYGVRYGVINGTTEEVVGAAELSYDSGYYVANLSGTLLASTIYYVLVYTNYTNYPDYMLYLNAPNAVPATPTISVALDASTGKPRISWNNIPSVTGYQIHYSTDGGSTYSLLNTATGTSHIHKTAAAGKTYYYKVRAVAGSTKGNFCTAKSITMPAAVSFTKHPSSVTAEAGGTAKFTVQATGSNLKYQWQYRTSSTGTWYSATATGNQTATLSVPVTASKNGYQYRCKVTSNGTTKYSNAATLTVKTSVTITTQPQNVTAEAGSTAKFTVKATGSNLKYQWQFRTSSSGTWTNTTATGNKTATLSVPVTAAKNGYQYRCKVTSGSVTKNSNAATLTVKTSVTITTQPQNVTAEAGSTAKFTVKATGSNLKYQWQYRTSASGSWVNATATGNKTATLSVPATEGRNGYQYRCKVTSNGVTKNSNAATLTVKPALNITSQPQNASAEAGGTAKFTVKATGSNITYQWQYRTSPTGSWYSATATGNKTATLSVPVTASKDGYQYRCKVTSGNTTKYSNAATLTVVAAVEIVGQPMNFVGEVGDVAEFTVETSGGTPTYQWQYRTSESGSWANATATGNKTATLSVPVTEGRNGYQYRCKVTTPSGAVKYSEAATLSVYAELEITAQPRCGFDADDNPYIRVKATGTDVTYQWQIRYGEAGEWEDATFEGNQSNVMYLTECEGYCYFRCKVSDAMGIYMYTDAFYYEAE